MAVIFRVLAFILIGLSSILAIYAVPIFREAGDAIISAEKTGFLQTQSNPPLTTIEQVVVFTEFEGNWKIDGPPCPAMRVLWLNLSGIDNRSQGATVSYFVAREIAYQFKPELSMRSRVRELLIACLLERKYENAYLLRNWLKRAYFGKGEYGIDVAANSIFGKPDTELTIEEAAALAALLRMPALRYETEHWAKRAELIYEKYSAVHANSRSD